MHLLEQRLARARREQADLIKQLAHQYAQILLVLAARLVGRDDAHDVAQEAFVSLAKWIARQPLHEVKVLLEDPKSMRKFMCKIASCRAYDLWRRRSRADLATSANADVEFAVDDRAMPDPQIAIEIARLERAYATLPPAQRIAHVLHHYYGFTDADLENELGFTKTNSRTLIRRANLALQRAMEHCDE